MNCPECGVSVEQDAQFCPKCYARIERTPWWRRLLSSLASSSKPTKLSIQISKSETFTTVDPKGERHEYRSMDEMPPATRMEMEKLTDEVKKQLTSSSTVNIYKIKDESGVERTYHSLEEMPPEIREKFKQAQKFFRTGL